ncbi:MFS transporter [Blastococcus sp. SYSU D00922]
MTTTTTTPTTAGRAGFDRRLVAPLVLGAVLNPVNSSIIAVSLIPIGAALGAPPAETAWLVSSLYLATAIGQPVVGRLVDAYGARRLYLAGAVLIGAGGLLGTVAPSLPVLVAARVVIGFGTCAGYPAAMALIRSEARRTGTDRPQGVLTVLAVSAQTVAVLGPPLGGLLIGVGGWRATFAVNVPLAIACLALGWWLLPRRWPSDGAVRTRLDLAGIGLFSVTLVALLLFLMDPAPGLWWLPAVSVLAAAGLVLRELRASDPFVDLRLLAGNPSLLATYGRAFLAQCAAYAYFFGFPQWLQDGRGLTAPHAGLLLAPMFGTAIVVSAVTGRRAAIRGKLLVGAATQAVVAGLLLVLGPESPSWLLVAIPLTAGIPLGLIGLANQNAVYVQADPARTASSAGLLRTFSYLGAIVAAGAIGLAYPDRADTAGLHDLAFLMLGLSAALLALTVADRGVRRVGEKRRTPPAR